MGIELISLDDYVAGQKPFILIYGPAGAGKTSLIASLQGRVLVADGERGLRSLFNTSIKDSEERKRFSALHIETVDDLRNLWVALMPQGSLHGQFDWLFLDGLAFIAENILKKHEKLLKEKDADGYGAAYKKTEDDIIGVLKAFRDLSKYIGIICTSKEKMTKIEISKDNTIDKFNVFFPGQKLDISVPHIPDEVWRMIVVEEAGTDGVIRKRRKLITQITSRSWAKSRGGLPDMVDVTDNGLKDILAKIG